MKKLVTGHGIKLWLSAMDTDEWASRPGESWPCSTLAGHRIFVEFDPRGNLVDFRIDGRDGDCDATELDAIVEDFLGSAHPIPTKKEEVSI